MMPVFAIMIHVEQRNWLMKLGWLTRGELQNEAQSRTDEIAGFPGVYPDSVRKRTESQGVDINKRDIHHIRHKL